ncbi:MAG: VOC family protein [Candidatus Binatia bacterium]
MPQSHDSFIWYELLTTDKPAAEKFYRDVVGWEMADAGQSGMRYTILSAGPRGVGGLMALPAQAREAWLKPGWTGYIGVADTDAMATRIAGAGGSILHAPDDIPNVGRFAVVADPGGAPFMLLTPRPPEREPPPIEPDSPGYVSWHELYADNGQEAAFAFYSALFGWTTIEQLDMGEMGTYRIFGADGVPFGGMMDKPADAPAAAWAFYVNVDGADAAIARITANGGQVLMGPHEVPGGSWIVQALDPQGISFALVAPER